MMNVKGIRNFILGTGAEVNYGICRGIWTFAHSRQCFKNFYKLYFGTAVTSKMFQGIFVHQLYLRLYCCCFDKCKSDNDVLPQLLHTNSK